MTSPPPPSNDTVLFRPTKKRKIYRQRSNSTETEVIDATPAIAVLQSLDELILAADAEVKVEGATVSMAEILRLRKQRRPKVGGVEFRAEGKPMRNEEGALVVMKEAEEEGRDEAPMDVAHRFAPQTGTVGDVNKHMMAFIDSRLAQSRLEGLEKATILQNIGTTASMKDTQQGGRGKEMEVQRQPAALGKLMEVDLGDEARDRNVERTNQAKRRMDGGEIEDEGAARKPAKIRLGPDGKPWRNKKKRRGSDDIKRDKMVEDVLRENRLEIYDELPVEPQSIHDDQAADDRIAEAFRKEFMDAVSQRQMKKVGPPPAPARTVGGKKDEAELKGPKLGGTRNQRAAMREHLLKEAAAKKK